MKKILVIMMMVLLCSTSVMGKTKKRSARNPKTKVERQMTDFEKRQKEERLAYLLYKCRAYYEQEDYEMADFYKRCYEETKHKNYYVSFTNPKYTDEERAKYKKLGIYLDYGTDFYMNGYVFNVFFEHDGKANDDVMTQFEGVYDYDTYNEKETRKLDFTSGGKEETKEKLLNEINEASGYNAKASKRKNEVEKFIGQHKAETTKPVAEKKQEQTNRPFSKTSPANRRFYQENKPDYSAYNHLTYPQKKENKLKQNTDKAKNIHW